MNTAAAATSQLAQAHAETAEGGAQVRTLAAQAAAPIDRITLLLAANFCGTAARHLAEAYAIVRDYDADNLDAPEKGAPA